MGPWKSKGESMKNKSVWAIGAVILLVGGALVVAQLAAQPRFPRPDSMPFMGPVQVGRYTVVKVEGSGSDIKILLLDTATGTLYQANDNDLKKYSELGKMGGPPRPPAIDVPPLKDAPPVPKLRPLPLKEGPAEKFKDKFKDE